MTIIAGGIWSISTGGVWETEDLDIGSAASIFTSGVFTGDPIPEDIIEVTLSVAQNVGVDLSVAQDVEATLAITQFIDVDTPLF